MQSLLLSLCTLFLILQFGKLDALSEGETKQVPDWINQAILDMSDSPCEDYPRPPVWPTTRTEFGSRGTSVRGWPSSGGIYIAADVYGVELDFLGLDRFKPSPRSENPAEEDAFCQRLRKVGAKWFKSEEDYFEWSEAGIPRDPEEDTELLLGWPEPGGVWVLKVNQSDAARKGVGRIKNAFTMEERCSAIEQLGGRFYSDPKDCPDTKDMI
jgi:hypothetical protein